jgi:hypothetical protein
LICISSKVKKKKKNLNISKFGLQIGGEGRRGGDTGGKPCITSHHDTAIEKKELIFSRMFKLLSFFQSKLGLFYDY